MDGTDSTEIHDPLLSLQFPLLLSTNLFATFNIHWRNKLCFTVQLQIQNSNTRDHGLHRARSRTFHPGIRTRKSTDSGNRSLHRFLNAICILIYWFHLFPIFSQKFVKSLKNGPFLLIRNSNLQNMTICGTFNLKTSCSVWSCCALKAMSVM